MLGYFAERGGVVVPEITVSLTENREVGGFFFGRAKTILLGPRNHHSLAHEYVHGIQSHLAPGQPSPTWITEGVAHLWSGQYFESLGEYPHPDEIGDAVLGARQATSTFERDEDGGVTLAESRALYHLAVNLLASLADRPDPWFDYYERRSAFPTWQDAVHAVFGLSVSDFYASFQEHRTEVAPPLPTIRGVVLGADGAPASGAQVRAIPQGDQRSARADVLEDGSFAMPVYEGSFLLEIHADSPGGRQDIGWYAEDGGFTLVRSGATVLDVTGDDVTGITIRIPQIDWRRIEGVVLGPAGEPVQGVFVDAYPRGDYPGPWDETDEEGRFTMFVAGGRFDLHLYADAPDGRHRIGYHGGEDGFIPLHRDITTIEVRERGLDGIVIPLPVSSVSRWYRLGGVVLGPEGEPVEGVLVTAHPAGEHPGWHNRTDEAGRFTIYVLGGSFELHLRFEGQRIGSYGGDGGFAPADEQAGTVHTRGQDVTGIEILFPFDPASQ